MNKPPDKAFRVTKYPEWSHMMSHVAEHMIIKDGDGNFYCQTHRKDAKACASRLKTDLVWTNSLDGGKYVANVIRVDPYLGHLTLTRDKTIVFESKVGIMYDAPFGPDAEDVREWMDLCLKAADDDYRRRGESPPT